MNNIIITLYHCKFNCKEHKNTPTCFNSSRLSLTVPLRHFDDQYYDHILRYYNTKQSITVIPLYEYILHIYYILYRLLSLIVYWAATGLVLVLDYILSF